MNILNESAQETVSEKPREPSPWLLLLFNIALNGDDLSVF